MKAEDVSELLVDAAYPAALAHGIPWHDDAVRIMLAAAVAAHEAMVRAKVAEEIEAEYHRRDIAHGAYLHAAEIARGGA
jgi:hypothetical protein